MCCVIPCNKVKSSHGIDVITIFAMARMHNMGRFFVVPCNHPESSHEIHGARMVHGMIVNRPMGRYQMSLHVMLWDPPMQWLNITTCSVYVWSPHVRIRNHYKGWVKVMDFGTIYVGQCDGSWSSHAVIKYHYMGSGFFIAPCGE